MRGESVNPSENVKTKTLKVAARNIYFFVKRFLDPLLNKNKNQCKIIRTTIPPPPRK